MENHTSPAKRRRLTEGEKRKVVEEFMSRGARDGNAFARRHGIAATTLRQWVQRYGGALNAKRSHVPFEPLVLVAPDEVAETEATPIDVVLPSLAGAVIRVHRGFDRQVLKALLAVIGEAQC